ncbi:MAG TPA: hypothetical protein VLC98_11145 [Phnomibacter sp.]|nr:hypothetical protein [Phnomibacter sp.]
MTNILFFSDYIKPVAKRLRFILIVCRRFFIILFRWRKGIKLLHLDYAKKYHFDSSYLIIRYRFRNALWYNFKNINKTTEKKIIVLNLKNVPEKPIELIVFGFFRRATFRISVTPESILQNNNFKISINGINEVEGISTPIVLKSIKPILMLPKINVNDQGLQIKQPLYNQTDFL